MLYDVITDVDVEAENARKQVRKLFDNEGMVLIEAIVAALFANQASEKIKFTK